jgi:hypothetical protein
MSIANKIRIAIVFILLFLTVAVDFVSGLMSMLADGVFCAGVVVALWPIFRQLNKGV